MVSVIIETKDTTLTNRIYGGLLRATLLVAVSGGQYAHADGGVVFKDIAAGDRAGITYRSQKTPADEIWAELKKKPVYYLQSDGPLTPGKSRGNPGAALLDYDNDGDLDIYVTNSSLVAANSLYKNLLKETGKVFFVDVAKAAGVEALGHGSTGVCFGDIDNNGTQDIYIVGEGDNILFMNRGNGTFRDITRHSNLGGGKKHDSSCSFGDVNGDGLLDVAIANSYDNWNHRLPLQLFEYSYLIERNQLFVNKGNNVFDDISASSGIQNVQHITWSIAMVDIDQDGDMDIVASEDQGPKPPAIFGGQDVGYVRVLKNDGAGHFTDATETIGTNRFGAWMGASFGDLNADGVLDIHATNAGNYLTALMSGMVGGGDWGSGWFIGNSAGKYQYPGVGAVGTTPFGWGSAMVDYDNDGDRDIIFAGGLDMGSMVDSNPGAVLRNDGSGNFVRDTDALPATPYHLRRNVQGLAVGDIDNDGFVDVVSVSEMNWPVGQPLAYYRDFIGPLGGQFDDTTFWPTFTPVDPMNPMKGFTWNGIEPEDGTLAVMLSSGNKNDWVKVRVVGSKGLVDGGRVNRDGIGAVVAFTPDNGQRTISPVVSGGSHTSAHSLDAVFGLGNRDKSVHSEHRGREHEDDDRARGTIDILWTGGVRNKLYNVKRNMTVVFPEIPCSYDDESRTEREYRECVRNTLKDLVAKKVIKRNHTDNFYESAVRAYKEFRRNGFVATRD